tara:strand:+ start:654 stop:1349 length:696 start_codon:yes stop_codon:yes gene_type:complete
MINQNKEQILVVEDDQDIRDLIVFNLQKKDFNVKSTDSGDKAISLIREDNFNLILLDLMMPGIDGFDLTRIIKSDSKTSSIPIIMLTAKGDESDIVKGLELGADDYITKPFSVKVLIARINKVLDKKRSFDTPKNVIIYEKLSINIDSRDVSIDGKSIDLTFTEFEILKVLATHSKWVYTRSDLINHIRGDDYIVTDRTIDFQIVGLRKKLGTYGSCIKTVRGVGYRFLVE